MHANAGVGAVHFTTSAGAVRTAKAQGKEGKGKREKERRERRREEKEGIGEKKRREKGQKEKDRGTRGQEDRKKKRKRRRKIKNQNQWKSQASMRTSDRTGNSTSNIVLFEKRLKSKFISRNDKMEWIMVQRNRANETAVETLRSHACN